MINYELKKSGKFKSIQGFKNGLIISKSFIYTDYIKCMIWSETNPSKDSCIACFKMKK
jgi:hypothetical protein